MKNINNTEWLDFDKKMQEEEAGIEYCVEDDSEEAGGFLEREIYAKQKMLTVLIVERWIQDGTLILQPDFQRKLVWDSKRKSALMESLMLNIPIPAFYFDEDSQGNKTVIDGLQRLSTIHQYLNGEFRLNSLQYLPQCENKTFEQLDVMYRMKILKTVLMVNILDARCSAMVKMDIFRRVNTGGVQLNPQEIRNIMAKPSVREFLIEMSTCKEFLSATNNKVNDIRMGAQELCLRFITILKAYDWEFHDFDSYRGLLKMMDECILELNVMAGESRQVFLKRFRRVMRQCNVILGEQSFCKLGNSRVNKSLFTSWAVVLFYKDLEDVQVMLLQKKLRERYLDILEQDKEFLNAITSSTGSRKHIIYALETIRNIVEECYDF